jgi:predicted Zn-dependent protease
MDNPSLVFWDLTPHANGYLSTELQVIISQKTVTIKVTAVKTSNHTNRKITEKKNSAKQVFRTRNRDPCVQAITGIALLKISKPKFAVPNLNRYKSHSAISATLHQSL